MSCPAANYAHPMLMTAVEAAAENRGITLATLIVSSVAATAVISAAIVTAVLASRRERNSWLRAAQTEAYIEYSALAWRVATEAAGGPVEKALKAPGFVGLDEAWDDFEQHTLAHLHGMNRVTPIAAPRTLEASAQFLGVVTALTPLAFPLIGTANRAANIQRVAVLKALSTSAGRLGIAMRQDQGIGRFWRRGPLRRFLSGNTRRHKKILDLHKKDITKLTTPATPENARPALIEWQVRRWDDSIPVSPGGYLTDDVGWSAMILPKHINPDLLSAVLLRSKGEPWFLMIAERTPPAMVLLIEADCAEIVKHHGRGGVVKSAPSVWQDGIVEGQSVRIWPRAKIV
jgi:hypothetical protein